MKRLEKEGSREGEEMERVLKAKVEMEARVKRLEKELKRKDEELDEKLKEVEKERKKVTRVENELDIAKVSLPLSISFVSIVEGSPLATCHRIKLPK